MVSDAIWFFFFFFYFKRSLWPFHGEKEEAGRWLGGFFGSPGTKEMVTISKHQGVMSLEIVLKKKKERKKSSCGFVWHGYFFMSSVSESYLLHLRNKNSEQKHSATMSPTVGCQTHFPFSLSLVREAETPVLWPPDANSWLIGKDPDGAKDWGQKEKGATENEIVGIINSMDTSLSKLWEIVKDRGTWHAAAHGVTKSRTRLGDWTKQQQV